MKSETSKLLSSFAASSDHKSKKKKKKECFFFKKQSDSEETKTLCSLIHFLKLPFPDQTDRDVVLVFTNRRRSHRLLGLTVTQL